MINYDTTVLSQYANSPTLLALIDNFNSWVDPSADIDTFFNQVFNVDTATGYGLDVWGRIVGISRIVKIPSVSKNFGFQTGAGDHSFVPFNQGPFRNAVAAQDNYRMQDDAYRTMILFKAAANISNCSAPSINALLSALFKERGQVYVIKTGTMQISYVFEFILRTYEVSILNNTDSLIRPTGVQVTIIQNPPGGFFGFKQMKAAARPFGQGVFYTR